MKKTSFYLPVLLVIFLIATSIPTFASSGKYTPPDELRVGLSYGSSAKSTTQLSCASGVTIKTNSGETLYSTTNSITFTVRVSTGSVIEALIDTQSFTAEGELHIVPTNNIFNMDGKAYRGKLLLKRTNGSNMSVINVVGVDDYVRGVVASEMPSYYALEALKTQAVCARNYAIANLNKHSGYGFDICASIDCQVYGGIAAETERTNQAVESTANVIVLYDGAPAVLYFAATSGGHTENSEDVWGSVVPYLRGVEDPHEPTTATYHRWEYRVSQQELSNLMSSYNLGTITDIVVVSKTSSGAVLELKVVGTNGTRAFKKESARIFLGGDRLKSQAYTVTRSNPPTATSPKVQSNTSSTLSTVINALRVLTANSAKTLPGNSQKFDSALTKLATTHIPITFTATNPDNVGSGDFIFSGRGWGHLIGMSQNGAGGMANAGFTYEQILKHYYTDKITIYKD